MPARLRASANRANNPLQLTGSNKFNPRASIMYVVLRHVFVVYYFRDFPDFFGGMYGVWLRSIVFKLF